MTRESLKEIGLIKSGHSARIPESRVNGNGKLHLSADPQVDGVINAYHLRQQRTSGGLFSERVASGSTDLLDDLIKSGREKGRPLNVVELAAGPGVHPLTVSRELRFAAVTAIDSEPDYVAIMRQKETEQKGSFADGATFRALQADALSYVRGLNPGSVNIVHSNSFYHILPTRVRGEHLLDVRRVLADDGEVGASFKSTGDVQHARGTLVNQDERGDYIADPDDPRIVRLIVTNPKAIIRDYEEAGLDVVAVHHWAFEGYDGIPGESKFVAFKAVKR